jgi:hypothetical protein
MSDIEDATNLLLEMNLHLKQRSVSVTASDNKSVSENKIF